MASGGGGGCQTLAEVQVLMVKSGNDNSTPKVYGNITVAVTSPSGDQKSHILFHTAQDQAFSVPENTNIPLKLSKVPAQPKSTLQVHADLSDAHVGPSGNKIVNGSVSLVPPQTEDIAEGGLGKVRVNVNTPE